MGTTGQPRAKQRWWNSLHSWENIVSIPLIISGTLVTALLGILIPPGRWYSSCVGLCAALCALAFFFIIRTRLNALQKKRGTLYYLRFLDSSMSDVHESTLREAKDKYMDLRTITWSFPPFDEMYEETSYRPQMRDISTGVTGCTHALEQAMNNDTLDTQFTYAPNAIFPAGLAIGYQTYFMGNTTFVELPDGRENKDLGQWELQPWAVFEDAPTVSTNDDEDDGIISWPPVKGWYAPPQPTGDAPVALTWTTKPKEPLHPLPECWNIPESNHYVLEWAEDSGCTIPKDQSPKSNKQINEFAACCARSLWEVSQKHPDSPIVLCTRLPKSLQLAIGWRLAQKLDRPGPQRVPWNPWKDLITVQFEKPDPGRGWIIVRAHPAQPPLDEVAFMLDFESPTNEMFEEPPKRLKLLSPLIFFWMTLGCSPVSRLMAYPRPTRLATRNPVSRLIDSVVRRGRR